VIFDRFAQVVGSGIPMLRTPMAKAKLFYIEAHAKGTLPTILSDEQVYFMRNLFLPFQHVCIEDEESCTLLYDLTEGAVGARCERMFADCVILGDDGVGVIVVGRISIPTVGRIKYDAQVSLELACAFNDEKISIHQAADIHEKEIERAALSGGGLNAKTALEWVMYLNDKSRFILESTPIRREKKSKKIRPSYDRPLFTLLTPAKIRKVMKLDAPKEDGSGKRPHERRAHLRYYRSERYSEERRDKPQRIEAIWVGPKEATVGQRHYRVRVDI
jgi:hypothetical protein